MIIFPQVEEKERENIEIRKCASSLHSFLRACRSFADSRYSCIADHIDRYLSNASFAGRHASNTSDKTKTASTPSLMPIQHFYDGKHSKSSECASCFIGALRGGLTVFTIVRLPILSTAPFLRSQECSNTLVTGFALIFYLRLGSNPHRRREITSLGYRTREPE